MASTTQVHPDPSGDAEAELRSHLETHPGDVAALHQLALLCHRRGSQREAADLLDHAIATASGQALLYEHASVIYAILDDWKSSEMRARAGLEQTPESAALHWRLGQALRAQSRLAESAQALQKANALDPGLAPAVLDLSGVLMELSNWQEAAAVLQAAIAAHPEDGSLYVQRSRIEAKLGNHGAAVESLIKANFLLLGVDSVKECAQLTYRDYGKDWDPSAFGDPQTEPGKFSALVGLGNALRAKGRADSAEDAYRRALSLNPDSAPVLSRLACLLASQRRFEEASRILARLPEDLAGPEKILRLDAAFLDEMKARSEAQAMLPENRAESGPVTVLVSCDPAYFLRFSEPLARSMSENAGVPCRHRFHVVNADDACRRHAERLRALLPQACIEMSEEQRSFPDKFTARGYYASARFLQAPELLREGGGPLLILDADMIALRRIEPLLECADEKDVGLFRLDPGRHDPWDQYLSGVMLLNRTPAALRFMRRMGHYIRSFHDRGMLRWYIDQCALFATLACEDPDNPDTRIAWFDPSLLNNNAMPPGETGAESKEGGAVFWSLLVSVPSGRENLDHPLFRRFAAAG